MIDNKLIKNALALTGKTMGDMEEIIATNIMDYYNTDIYPEFSIEKFCYYLISLDFLYSYEDKIKCDYQGKVFLHAIQDFQEWNEERLIELLSKIWN